MYANYLANKLGLNTGEDVIQINIVSHTGASGFHRLANQPLFYGDIPPGTEVLMVDDFVGMGGTLANLKGHIEEQGGNVIGSTVLTGKPFSARLKLSGDMLGKLRSKHGTEIEQWWQQRFGFGFDKLTQSEARYLYRTKDVDTIRDKIIAATKSRGRPVPSGASAQINKDNQDPSDEGFSSSEPKKKPEPFSIKKAEKAFNNILEKLKDKPVVVQKNIIRQIGRVAKKDSGAMDKLLAADKSIAKEISAFVKGWGSFSDGFNTPPDNLVDWFKYNIVDRFSSLQKVQKSIEDVSGKLADSVNVYMQETLESKG